MRLSFALILVSSLVGCQSVKNSEERRDTMTASTPTAQEQSGLMAVNDRPLQVDATTPEETVGGGGTCTARFVSDEDMPKQAADAFKGANCVATANNCVEPEVPVCIVDSFDAQSVSCSCGY